MQLISKQSYTVLFLHCSFALQAHQYIDTVYIYSKYVFIAFTAFITCTCYLVLLHNNKKENKKKKNKNKIN